MTTTIDGKEFSISKYSKCSTCKHFDRSAESVRKCKAFDSIPLEIWDETVSHNKPYPGDNGIVYEKRTE